MTAMADYLESQVVQHIFRTGTFTKPTVLTVALCTAAPTDTHTGTNIPEVANSFAYARVANNPLDANWNNVSSGNGTTSNVAAVTFTTASGGDWGTVTHVAITDNVTHGQGNLFFWGSLTGNKVVNNGDTFQFNASNLSIQIDN